MSDVFNMLMLKEAIASVAMEHAAGCKCDTCLAAQGDRAAFSRILLHLQGDHAAAKRVIR
jgi:hypothetical protein